MEFRLLIRNIILLCLIVGYGYGMYWCYQFFTDGFNKNYCGKVEKKLTEQYYHKSTSRTDYIMIIDFEIIGRQEIDVTRSTYFNRDQGDNVCFTFSVTDYEKPAEAFKLLWGIVSGLITCIILFILLMILLGWIFTGKW